ncbi:hypothetical protein GP486_001481 [Trichoglossum hirsutum]|uniref:ABM domain-containing protein n=1 Tax=Trichoglossum hirsutum TaxID=265104 RepID=A0A9P8LGU1_9PEZI|nr:hypothetical protein GP486_001481 [Trichoglossum hirsutum]
MTTPITQLTVLSLLPNATVEDGSSEPGRIWASALETIALQPGHRHTYWGRQIEDSSILHLHIDWSDISAHRAFLDSQTYKSFSAALSSVLAKPPTIRHANLAPHPLASIFSKKDSPVTELVTFYLPSPLSATTQADFDSTIAAFSAHLTAKAEGSTANAGGWVVEELDHAEVGRVRAYLAAYGWTSVDAHMKYRETKDFLETIVWVREKIVKGEMYHVVFEDV